MKAKSVLILVSLLLSVILFNSCQDSPVNIMGSTNVSGTVRGISNYPLDNVKITIKDKSFITLSDGKFSFENVSSPYDIYLKDSVRQYEIIYKNVNTDNLVINLPTHISQGLVNYNLLIHYPVSTPPQKRKIYFIDDEKDIIGVADYETGSSIVISAPPNLTLTGKVVLLTYTLDGNEHLNDYKYFAEKSNVTIVSGSTTEITITQEEMKTVDEETVSCIINPPQGNSSVYSGFALNFLNKKISYFMNYLAADTFLTNNISVLMPKNLPVDFTPTLFTVSVGSNGISQQMSILPKTGTNVQINIPPTPYVITPEDNAINVDLNTVFSFQKQSISNVLIYSLMDTVSNISYCLCTSDNNITLSMLSPMITNLLPNRKYAYGISQVGMNINTVGEFLRDGRAISTFQGFDNLRRFTSKP